MRFSRWWYLVVSDTWQLWNDLKTSLDVLWLIESHLSGWFCLFAPNFFRRWQGLMNGTFSFYPCGLSRGHSEAFGTLELYLLQSTSFTVRNYCCGKIMFSQASVVLSTEGGGWQFRGWVWGLWLDFNQASSLVRLSYYVLVHSPFNPGKWCQNYEQCWKCKWCWICEWCLQSNNVGYARAT